MTEAPPLAKDAATLNERNMALVNYGLLFASVFFAGIPGLIAAVIAYAQRDAASPYARSHFNFQIRIFWVAFGLTILGAAAFVGALVMGVGEIFQFFATNGSWDAWDGGVTLDISDISVDAGLVVMAIVCVISWILTGLWLLAAPAFGFIRLASERCIGQQAP